MKKNWLIRTHNNHILGPVSIEKIRLLISNNSLKSNDEICSGNGYWFSIKETDLVQKYIHEEKKQSFNPISEAKSVLVESKEKKNQVESEDITLHNVQMPDFNKINDIKSNFSIEEDEVVQLIEPIKKKKIAYDEEKKSRESKPLKDLDSAKILNSRILYILGLVFFVIALTAFYYRHILIENIIN